MSDWIDVAQAAFMNKEGEMRSGWRVLTFVVLLVVSLTLISTLISALGALVPQVGLYLFEPPPGEGATPRAIVFHNVNNVVYLTAGLIATAAAARWLERRSFASVGFKLHRDWLRDFAAGSLLGAATLAVAVATSWAAGATSFQVNNSDGPRLALDFLILFIFFLIAAAFEEVVFRGFAFQALLHNIGAAGAIAATSLLFAAAHLPNPNASPFAFVNTVLAGVWLGVAYLKTRSLWLATALHYSWNLVMVFVFGLPVSGITTFGVLAWLSGGSADRAEWLSGGSYGPEGGAAATVALLLSTALIWRTGLFKPSEEMLAAIKHGDRMTEPTGLGLLDIEGKKRRAEAEAQRRGDQTG